ncbi:hypothetical protein, partial [Thiolapillus sp.]|uniref:hypothetical protein n=2 Tax=Thiolapillus sp. TaxID=2017437 RepID=UPI003AF80D0A
ASSTPDTCQGLLIPSIWAYRSLSLIGDYDNLPTPFGEEPILKVVKQEVIHLVIDDTLTLRASKKAPGSQIHHQHGNKPNLAQYVRGQCWVSLAWVIRREKQPVALPLLTRLVPGISNTGKRVAAKTLIRAVYRLLDGRKVRVLVDSWYMRRIFIESMLARGFESVRFGLIPGCTMNRRNARKVNEVDRESMGENTRPSVLRI